MEREREREWREQSTEEEDEEFAKKENQVRKLQHTGLYYCRLWLLGCAWLGWLLWLLATGQITVADQ
jgi:hypothetical protein